MDAYLHRRTQASTAGPEEPPGRARQRRPRRRARADPGPSSWCPATWPSSRPAEAFPADGIIVGGAELQVDESSLTGEAYPVAKRPLTGAARARREPLVDVQHWGFAGTRLLTGRATLRVTFTGGGDAVRRDRPLGRPRRARPHAAAGRHPAPRHGPARCRVGHRASILAAVRIVQGHGWLDALLSAVTLAAAAIPEEFPVVFTFFLGVGVYRLARRQALVRRAVAVENIGRITAICSDKTGTITEGRLRLTHLVPAEGVGRAGPALPRRAGLARATAAIRSTRPSLRRAGAAGAAKLAGEMLATFPFTEDRRRETAIVRAEQRAHDGGHQGGRGDDPGDVGAPSDDREPWDGARRAPGRGGAQGDRLRVAVRSTRSPRPRRSRSMAIASPGCWPSRTRCATASRRPSAPAGDAGIHAIMVTGDHPVTARAVAREIGLGGTAPRVVTGDAMEALVARGEGRDPARGRRHRARDAGRRSSRSSARCRRRARSSR